MKEEMLFSNLTSILEETKDSAIPFNIQGIAEENGERLGMGFTITHFEYDESNNTFIIACNKHKTMGGLFPITTTAAVWSVLKSKYTHVPADAVVVAKVLSGGFVYNVCRVLQNDDIFEQLGFSEDDKRQE